MGPTTSGTKGDAEIWLADERRVLESGHWTSPVRPQAEVTRTTQTERLAKYAQRWLTQRRVKGEPLRASTVVDYERALRLYINPYLGGRALGDITRADVRHWHNVLLQKVSDRPGSKTYAVLRTIMNSAVEEELIDVSPVTAM